MIIMTVVTKINAFKNLIRCYKNWPAITMSYMLKRNPRELVLRTGQRLPSTVDFYPLMRLMLSGWKFEDVDEEFMSILNTSGVRINAGSLRALIYATWLKSTLTDVMGQISQRKWS
jgi:hypothetical protein